MSIDVYPNNDARIRFGATKRNLGSGSLLYANDNEIHPDFEGRDLISLYEGRFYNLSRDASTVRDVYTQVYGQFNHPNGQEQREAVDMVFVTIGGNDLLMGLSFNNKLSKLQAYEEKLEKDYAEMVDFLFQQFPNAQIVLNTVYDPTDGTGYFPGSKNRLPLEVLKKFNAFVRDFETHDRIITVDLYSEFMGKGTSVMTNPDGSLNDSGYYWSKSIIEPNVTGASKIRELWLAEVLSVEPVSTL